jgi:hypothetical protein
MVLSVLTLSVPVGMGRVYIGTDIVKNYIVKNAK